MKISEIITDKYKLRIPPTVYYDLLVDVVEAEEEQEPKTGHWICHREHCENLGVMPSGLGAYEWCSNCDCGIDVKEWHRNNYNYCPNCGARMESEDKG